MVHAYQLALAPGLLQTAEYAQAVFRGSPPLRADAELDRVVQVRLRRQRRLVENPPLELVAVVDETVLRRPIGEVQVMQEQLRHLERQAALPSVCFQVLPASAGAHEGLNGEQTDCVEVAEFSDRVAMRDSKSPAGPILAVPRAQWRAFLSGVRVDRFC